MKRVDFFKALFLAPIIGKSISEVDIKSTAKLDILDDVKYSSIGLINGQDLKTIVKYGSIKRSMSIHDSRDSSISLIASQQ